MNPRVLAWLKAVGLEPAAIVRRAGEDVPIVEVAGERNLWTVHYMGWIGARWREWAVWHHQSNGDHRAVLRAGYDDFDEWLEARAA